MRGATGTGTFSTVRVATHKDTGMQYAVKAINLTDIQPQTLIRLRREIQVPAARVPAARGAWRHARALRCTAW